MSMHYNIELKKKLCYNICINGDSTIKTAEEFNVPLKTLEKWITAYNKDEHCFDENYISPSEQIAKLQKENKKLKETNEILKKAVTFFAKEK